MREREPAGESLFQRHAASNGFGIAVDGEHFAIGALEKRLRSAAAAERTVDVMRTCARRNRLR